MSKRAFGWAFSMLGAVLLAGVAAAGELDATAWNMQPKGILGAVSFWNFDLLRFEDGKFSSSKWLKNGFQTAPYQTRKEGKKIIWTATLTNEKGERMEWDGRWSGGRMDGNVTWFGKDGKTTKIRWKANKKTP